MRRRTPPALRSRSRAAWAAWAACAGLATLALLPAGCADLFHSTDFGDCPADGGCLKADGAPPVKDAGRDGAGGKGDASRDSGPRDAGHRDADATGPRDATMGHDAPRDVQADARRDGGKDGGRDTGADGPPDAGIDAPADAAAEAAVDAGLDAPAPVDAGTDFCAWGHAVAQTHASHACLWLGACLGNAGVNEFGTCYPDALLAYDCALNPNQRVRGELHTFWDALWQVHDCQGVLAAMFPAGVPSCLDNPTGCGNGLPAGGPYGDIVVACSDAGTVGTAQNCAVHGYTCDEGACTNGGAACAGVTGTTCAGNVFHACQKVEADGGHQTPVVDVGKDCTNFGAGKCVVPDAGDSGAGGCLPNDAGAACPPSIFARCTPGDPSSVTGCATGHAEVVHCVGFGAGNACAIQGPWFASSTQLSQGCYDPLDNGESSAFNSCNAIAAFSDYAGPAGNVEVHCADAGLGSCTTTKISGYRPVCAAP